MAPTSMKQEIQQFWSQLTSKTKESPEDNQVAEALETRLIATPCRSSGKARTEGKKEAEKSAQPEGARKRKARWDELPALPATEEVSKVSLSSKGSIRSQTGGGGFDKRISREPIVLPKQQKDSMAMRKRREVYVGNLQLGEVSCELIQKTFRKFFQNLPDFVERYPDVVEPVRSVLIPSNSTGMFAFVELFDETLANTAIMMSGFELAGRAVKVGRPQLYEPPPEGQEKLPLDVEPLRTLGLIPDLGSAEPQTLLARELYFGNLSVNHVTEETMKDLLTPACEEHPTFDSSKGPPINDLKMASNGYYCFVQFQTAEIASCMLEIFDEVEFCGRTMRVRRPANYVAAMEACGVTALPEAPKVVPPPPPPVVLRHHNEKDAFPPTQATITYHQDGGAFPPPPPPPSHSQVSAAQLADLEKAILPPPPPRARENCSGGFAL